MVVERKTFLNLRCPTCGTSGSDMVEIFNFSGNRKVEIKCDCGQLKAVCGRGKDLEYWVFYICAICEMEHYLKYSSGRFWGKGPLPVSCPETGVQLGTIGPLDTLNRREEEHRQSMEMLINAIGNADYFVNPLIMLDMLDRIQELVSRGQVKCLCGSRDIHIDLFPDQIKLLCGNCAGHLILPAYSESNMHYLSQKSRLILARKLDMLKG